MTFFSTVTAVSDSQRLHQRCQDIIRLSNNDGLTIGVLLEMIADGCVYNDSLEVSPNSNIFNQGVR